MSNNTVGDVYKKIIDDVLESSKQDFEDAGVDESVIAELRMVRAPSAFIDPAFPMSESPSLRSRAAMVESKWPPCAKAEWHLEAWWSS